MVWPILSGDFKYMKKGEPVELIRTEYPQCFPYYHELAKLYYFEDVDDEGVLLALRHPSTPEDTVYVRFESAVFNGMRRLRRIQPPL